MMVVTSAIQNLIRENKTYRIDSAIQTGRRHGMFLLDDCLYKHWRNGVCEKEECLLRAQRPADLAAKIAAAERGEDEDEYDDDEYGDDDYEDEEEGEEEDEDDGPRGKRRGFWPRRT